MEFSILRLLQLLNESFVLLLDEASRLYVEILRDHKCGNLHLCLIDFLFVLVVSFLDLFFSLFCLNHFSILFQSKLECQKIISI